MNSPFLPWRSLLYVPAHNQKFIAGAAKRGADAVVLDLEDGVPQAYKDVARHGLGEAVAQVSEGGVDVLVRVNRPWGLCWRDLEAVVAAGVGWVLLPKVETAAQVSVVAEFMDDLEVAHGREKTHLLLLIESACGLLAAPAILRASPRVCAAIPGNEDLATELGIDPEPAAMLYTHMPLILAARAAGVALLGLIGSGANFRDEEAYRRRAQLARSWGFGGATCVHPAQIAILNEVFVSDPRDIGWAQAVVAAFEASGGNPTSVAGSMVDAPIVARARLLLKASGQ